MLDDVDCLQPTLAAWEKVRLSERHAILDQQGLQIADNREEASSGRGALKDVIRAFKSTPQEERADKIGGVVKAFQGEVDALTRRQAFAEGAFLDLYRSLDAAPDPRPALKEAVAAQRADEERRAEHEATKRELANYEKEFAQLTNQAQTIKGLKAQLPRLKTRTRTRTPTPTPTLTPALTPTLTCCRRSCVRRRRAGRRRWARRCARRRRPPCLLLTAYLLPLTTRHLPLTTLPCTCAGDLAARAAAAAGLG